MNESYKAQVDSLKQLFFSQGYEMVREASVKMESEYELPIVSSTHTGRLVPVYFYWRSYFKII